jgi:class 3 adenylate cyclase/tetratricopeptide (TPR) repeat protein
VRCLQCKRDNPAEAKFCIECGAWLGPACSKCTSTLPVAAKFCPECGHQVDPGPRTLSRPTSPQTYTPKHLAEKILTSKSALEGERKQVTVLFADLKGSMELLADRDPEEARRLLDPVLERMMEAVHHYEGTVNQVMGDGIMALFGAPVTHEDHAVRACYAALRMQRRVSLYADELQREGGTPVQIRVGLNSGEVVVRAIGSDLHMDYTAVGQTTHLAARMEQMAKPRSTLVTGDTLALAEGYVQVKPLGAIPVKGLETPAQVYELTGPVPTRSRLQASAVRGLTRFVGRDREMEQLAQALERAASGHGQVVAVVGEAGVGKSRFLWEFTRSHHTHGWLVLESGAVSYGKATPYLPVIELLKAYCRIQERDDPRAIRERVAGKLLTLDRALEPLLTPLLVLLDVPVEDSAWDALDPPRRRQRTLEAVKRLLLRESQAQPLLVLFEDLHWIDSETQAFLDGLLESLPTARVLLLVNFRPEYEHPWGRKTYYLQLRIDPLPPESADALLNALLGEDRTLEPLRRMLIDRTQGNPFFLEESVQALVETTVFVGERGAYRMTEAPETWQVPATVQAVLAARIDRLPPEEKRLLESASVIGKDVPFDLLHAITATPDEVLHQGLAHLQGAEFLYETSLFPDIQFTFKHALTHEVAYRGLLKERQRALHAHIAEAMERLYADRLNEQVEHLAHHAFQGEVWDKAGAYLRQAGTKAAARSANRQAVAFFKQALLALAHLPESRKRSEDAIDLRLDLRNSLQPLGDNQQALDYLHEAATLAELLGDQRRHAVLSSSMIQHLRVMGDLKQALLCGQRALAIASTLGDVGLQIQTGQRLGQVYYVLGDYGHAIDFLRRIVETLEGERAQEHFGSVGLPAVICRMYLAWCLAEVGEFGGGLAFGKEGLRIAEEVGRPFDLIAACVGIGGLSLVLGDLPNAIAMLDRGLTLCQKWDLPLWFATTSSRLGYAYALSGRVDEALPLLERAVDRSPSTGTVGLSLVIRYLSEALVLAGRAGDALPLARDALARSRDHKERGYEAWALRLLGEIAAHPDSPDMGTAEAHYQQAISLAGELGMRPLVAHCHLGLGKLYRRTGDAVKAQDHLHTAATMYREMDMRSWRDQVDAETVAMR